MGRGKCGTVRILITNNSLDERAGTELYVRDIAFRLRELGHTPVCVSFRCGAVAEELRAGGVEVGTSLAVVQGPFDVIHGHHRLETSLAAMAFPRVPALSFCHGPKAWEESPAVLPNVLHYVAVDEACRARLLQEGVPEHKISLRLNFADTRRFLSRAPLPATPRKALVFSNRASDQTHLPVIQAACQAAGISVDVAGHDSGRLAEHPEELLPRYDLVFAKARAAIEAMAVGCAVIQCDFFGAGRLVTSERFDAIRPLNFGYLSMKEPLTAEHLLSQIRAYDAADAAAVSARIRAEASLDGAMPGLLALYEQVRAMPVPEFDPWQSGSGFIQELVAGYKEGKQVPSFAQKLEKERELAAALRTSKEGAIAELQNVRRLFEDERQEFLQKIASLEEAVAQKKRPWSKWFAR